MSAAIILATGPSLNAETIKLFQNYPRYAVNDAYRLDPDCHYIVASDELWWDFNHRHVDHTRRRAELWTRSQPAGARYQIHHIKPPKPGVYDACNSALLAAYLATAKHQHTTLVFLGLDLSDKHGEHFFGPHPDGLRRPHKFHNDIAQFERVYLHWQRHGIRALNATPATALTCLPVMTPEEALQCLQTAK